MAAARAWTDFRGSFHWDEDAAGGRCELSAEDALSFALKGELTAEEAISLTLPGELRADGLLPLAIRMGLTTEELLLTQLLASFDGEGKTLNSFSGEK